MAATRMGVSGSCPVSWQPGIVAGGRAVRHGPPVECTSGRELSRILSAGSRPLRRRALARPSARASGTRRARNHASGAKSRDGRRATCRRRDADGAAAPADSVRAGSRHGQRGQAAATAAGRAGNNRRQASRRRRSNHQRRQSVRACQRAVWRARAAATSASVSPPSPVLNASSSWVTTPPASRAGLQHDDIVLNPGVWRDAHREGALLHVVILRDGVKMAMAVQVGKICIG